MSLESKLLRPDRLSVIAKMFSWPVGSKEEGAAPEIDSQIDPDITPDITSDISPEHRPMGRRAAVSCAVRVADFLADGAGQGTRRVTTSRRWAPPAAPGPKKFVRLASVFPSPPFRSSDFAGPRRPRLYGFHTGTRSLSNRKRRGRRSGT